MPDEWCSACDTYHPYRKHLKQINNRAWWCIECRSFHVTEAMSGCPINKEATDSIVENVLIALNPKKEEKTMTIDIEGRRKVFEQRLDDAAETLAMLDRFEEWEFPVSSVLSWTNERNDTMFAVVASTEPETEVNRWQIYGANYSGQYCSADGLLDMITRGSDVQVATKWKHI